MNHIQSHPITLSHHAAARSAQRAIPHAIVEALLQTGIHDHDHRGGIRVHVHEHRSKQRFIEQVGREAGERYSVFLLTLKNGRLTFFVRDTIS